MMSRERVIKWIEHALLLIVIIFYIQPIVGSDNFITQDGPSHIYNTHVLKSLIFESENTIQSYYNYELKNSPNWVVNLLYFALLSIFSQAVSYKIVHLLICVLLPSSIFYVIKKIRSENTFLVLFSIPFVYTLSFVIGFNNFCLGLSLSLFTYGYWLRKQGSPTWKNSVLLFLFSIVLYYTHLVAVCLFLLLILINLICSFELSDSIKSNSRRFILQLKEKKILIKLLPFLFVLALIASQFFTGSNQNEDIASLSKLLKMRNMNVFYTSKEESYAKLLSMLLLLMTIISIFLRKNGTKMSTASWVSAVVLLFLYLFAPNEMAGGSFVSHRLELIFFVFVIIALSTTRFPTWSRIVLTPIALFFCWGFYAERTVYFQNISDEYQAFSTLTEKMEDHSTLLYLCHNASGINESGGYISPGMGMFHHVDCFVAMQKKDIVILKNYETHYDYFPIKWKPEVSPHAFLACTPYSMNNDPPCVNIENYNKEHHQVDYILVYKKPNKQDKPENELKTEAYISENYDQVSVSGQGTITLFKKRG